MKVAVIGTGRVGSLLLQYLMENNSIEEILMVNRDRKKSEGIWMDTVSAFPEKKDKLKISNHSDVEDADVVVITAGAIMKANQSPIELVEENKKIMKDIISKIKFKENVVLIVIATQVDIVTQYTQKISGLSVKRVLGFGGSLDVNRLKIVLSEGTKKDSSKISGYFIGEHGKRGFAIFEEDVEDRNQITEKTRNYFSEIAKRLDESTAFGPAKVLSELIDSVVNNKKSSLCVSCFHPTYGIYLTWPCVIGKNGVEKIIDLELSDEDLTRLKKLVEGKREI